MQNKRTKDQCNSPRSLFDEFIVNGGMTADETPGGRAWGLKTAVAGLGNTPDLPAGQQLLYLTCLSIALQQQC